MKFPIAFSGLFLHMCPCSKKTRCSAICLTSEKISVSVAPSNDGDEEVASTERGGCWEELGRDLPLKSMCRYEVEFMNYVFFARAHSPKFNCINL